MSVQRLKQIFQTREQVDQASFLLGCMPDTHANIVGRFVASYHTSMPGESPKKRKAVAGVRGDKYLSKMEEQGVICRIEKKSAKGDRVVRRLWYEAPPEAHTKVFLPDMAEDNAPFTEKGINATVKVSAEGIEIAFEGYGVMTMEGDSCGPIYIECHKGHPRVLIWGDIQKEDPTEDISLEYAHLSEREDEDGTPSEGEAGSDSGVAEESSAPG